jgi:integrase/recombinase XerD
MDHAAEYSAFQALLQAKGYRPATVVHYTSYVRRYLRHLEDHHRRDDISPASARDFLLDLAGNVGASTTTYNIAFNAVRHFLADRTGVKHPDFGGLKPQRRRRSARRVLSPDSVVKILMAVEHVRHRTALTVMYGLGLRLGEVCALRLTDIEPGTGIIVIAQGKGGEGRRIPAPSSILALLRRHWRHWRPVNWIFTHDGKPDGKPVAKDSVQRAFRLALRATGIATEGSTHLLRHSFACHQVAAGCDLRSLQAALGHRNLNTTLTYLGDLDALQGQRPPVSDLLAPLADRLMSEEGATC